MGKRAKLKNSLGVILEMTNEDFREESITPIENLFEQMEYGEILIKVVKGEIASIEVRNKYQPIILDKDE